MRGTTSHLLCVGTSTSFHHPMAVFFTASQSRLLKQIHPRPTKPYLFLIIIFYLVSISYLRCQYCSSDLPIILESHYVFPSFDGIVTWQSPYTPIVAVS